MNEGWYMNSENAGIDVRLFDYIAESLKKTAFYNLLGIRLVKLGLGESEFALTTGEQHCNPLGLVHGGVVLSLGDAAMGNAVRSLGVTGVTVDYSASLFSAAPMGQDLIGKGRIVKAGKNLFFTESDVWCQDKRIAQCKGTFYKVGDIRLP